MPAPVAVLGATGATGEALARRLAAAGTPVFLIARDEARVAALARDLGAEYAVADALDEAALTAAVARAGEGEGEGLAGLAYCIGSIVLKPLAKTTAADFEQAWRLNVLGAALAVKAAAPALTQANGAVVLFSSVAARSGFPAHAAIGSAKAAVEGLVASLAAELAPRVRINAVAPSLSDTAMAKPLIGTEAMAKGIAALHPIPRLGTADDLAAAAAWLLGPESSWVTGQVLAVDGGRGVVAAKR